MTRFILRHPSLFFTVLLLVSSWLESGDAFGIPTNCEDNGLVERISFQQDRRKFLLTSLPIVGSAVLSGGKEPASAAYGESTSMELPNYIEFLIEKNAVADPDSFLYKGPDPKVQLKRLLEASKRLEDIPPLAADKKWSQVQGILTGPLGTLAQTLNSIAKDSSPEVQAKAKKVKETIFSISTSANKKNEAEVVAKSKAAAADLEAFVRAAF